MTLVEFNVNEYVRVKLTPKGFAILHEEHEAVRRLHPKMQEWKPPQVDADGYTRFQAWNLMQVFGPHISLGMNNVPFETTIKIELPSQGTD